MDTTAEKIVDEYEPYYAAAVDFLEALRRSGVRLVLGSGVELLPSVDIDLASKWASDYTKVL